MIRKIALCLTLLVSGLHTYGQTTFKAGWNTYNTGAIIHEYCYTYTYTDSVHLYLSDSSQTLVSTDSMVTLRMHYPAHEKTVYKTINYFNAKRQVVKCQEYKGDDLQESNEWRYDDKNRKIYHYLDNKVNGNNYKKNYEYVIDKKSGDCIITESSYFNGKIEFYTKSYYDKNAVKYKEVRLNDNNKDIIHIESYTYGDNGKVKERSVYFPEFKVTKKFTERDGYQLPKCFKSQPAGIADKPMLGTKVAYLKKLFNKNQALITDKDCSEFEYTFTSGLNCEVILNSTKINNTKQATFRLKEKL